MSVPPGFESRVADKMDPVLSLAEMETLAQMAERQGITQGSRNMFEGLLKFAPQGPRPKPNVSFEG